MTFIFFDWESLITPIFKSPWDSLILFNNSSPSLTFSPFIDTIWSPVCIPEEYAGESFITPDTSVLTLLTDINKINKIKANIKFIIAPAKITLSLTSGDWLFKEFGLSFSSSSPSSWQ